MSDRPDGDPTMIEFEYHEIVRPAPLSFKEITQFGLQGWCLFNVQPPESPEGRWSHYFRRRSADEPDRRPAPQLRGGLDRAGPGLGDLVGHYPDGVPIRIRR